MPQVEEMMITEEWLPIHMVDRLEGQLVPDGFSCSIRDANSEANEFYLRFHVKLQHTLPDGTVVRFKIAVPKDGGADPSTWSVERQVKTP